MYLIMGYPNHMREEAGEMARKSEQTVLLFCMLFAFACLLFGGGWRLVGSEQAEDAIPVRSCASIRTVLSPINVKAEERASAMRSESAMQRLRRTPAVFNQVLRHQVQSDSNGNVLTGGTYMRAVYQVFALDDGFV